MDERQIDERIENAVRSTEVFRPPKQSLATFGTTTVRYHLVAEPVYADLDIPGKQEETVIREGTVHAERPQVVTPRYLSQLEGFTENAGKFLEHAMRVYGADTPGLLYAYRNEMGSTDVVSGAPGEVAARIKERLDREDRRLEAVIKGVDDLWDVSVMKFIFELTNSSVRSNVSELNSMGLLDSQSGVPRDARVRIDRMLEEARRGNLDPSVVHRELERWGLFEEYEDRFYGIFRGR